MAEVIAPDHPARYAGHSIGSMAAPGGPRIEMIPNPDFSFPPRRPTSLSSRQEIVDDSSRRPASMHINLPPPQNATNSHRRATSTLPSFTFNSLDTSGLQDAETPPQTPDENVPITPSRRGHRRGGSEFVGGDSRMGVENAVSSSPTKTNAMPLPVPAAGPPPSGRRGHAHRRSAAMSSHDVGSIMQPQEALPRLSNSLPNTPLEHPSQEPSPGPSLSSELDGEPVDPFGPPLDDVARPPSRPRVGFSDNVEYIPRPLSTISSETESSMSTVRASHSYNNSINSIVSMGTPSPQSARIPRTSISSVQEDEAKARPKSSVEISKRVEKEGEWLKSRSGSLKRPLSESAMGSPKTTFVTPEPPVRPRNIHNKKHSFSHALGFDRRRSEPTIGMTTGESSGHSTVSLQDAPSGAESSADDQELRDNEYERMSSAKKLKQWATSKMHRKSKEMNKALTATSSASLIRPVSEGSISVPEKVPITETPVAETDLDAVLSNQDTASDSHRPIEQSQPAAELSEPMPNHHSSFRSREIDDSLSPVLDLDAALGPFKTPPIGSHRQRKELHSSRLNKDFTGPGGQYHRRTESAPALPPFECGRVGTPQSSMADVFEEDEEDEPEVTRPPKPASVHSAPELRHGMDVQVVDLEQNAKEPSINQTPREGLGILPGEWEPERSTTAHGNTGPRFSAMGLEPRAASIVEETIMEEAGPGENVEIVEAHEEPRASSLTKSSDSSDTPTILPPQLTLPDGQPSLVTPDTYQTSTFSSPDFSRRQGSFDTSRLGTSASSMTDNRTMSSCATGEPLHELRVSVDDVPSLTSSRSTMLSTAHANNSRRDFNASRNTSDSSEAVDPTVAAERRRKRGSIQSLSQLVGGSFGQRSKGPDESRPHTATESATNLVPKKKEHRLKKLMFWRSKQNSKQT